jgi:hypothetical protein
VFSAPHVSQFVEHGSGVVSATRHETGQSRPSACGGVGVDIVLLLELHRPNPIHLFQDLLPTAQTPSTSPLMELMMLEAIAMLLVSGDHARTIMVAAIALSFRFAILRKPLQKFRGVELAVQVTVISEFPLQLCRSGC